MPYTAFAAMNAMIMRDKMIHTGYLMKCMELVATYAKDIPLTDVFEFAESSHFCLPIALGGVVDREKLKDMTNIEKDYPWE